MESEPTLRDDFLEECEYAMGFLATEYGFKGTEIEDDPPHTVWSSYYKGEIAIECSLDIRDEMISVRVVLLDGGRKPEAWKVNGAGQVVRGYLTALLIRRGVRESMSKDIPGIDRLTKRRALFRQTLVSDARLLKKYGQDILAGSGQIFEGYRQPNGGTRFNRFRGHHHCCPR